VKKSKMAVYIALFFYSASVFAEVEVMQSLSFGTLAVLSNNQVQTLTLTKEGDVYLTNDLISVVAPQRALFRLFNIQANQTIIVRGTIINSELQSSELNTEAFTFESLNMKTVFVSDDFGEVIIPVGGTISTSGNGNMIFGGLPLTADFYLEISY
jgi:hypothetical protein